MHFTYYLKFLEKKTGKINIYIKIIVLRKTGKINFFKKILKRKIKVIDESNIMDRNSNKIGRLEFYYRSRSKIQ